MSGVGVSPEQDFEARVVEWESRAGLWDQLVGEAWASSGDGFPIEDVHVGQDGVLGEVRLGSSPDAAGCELER